MLPEIGTSTVSDKKSVSLRQSVKDKALSVLRTPSNKGSVKDKDEIRSQILDHLVERVK